MKLNLKRALAKEGLILILIGAIVYFSIFFLLQRVPVIYPKYKIKFANGQAYTIDIYPDIDYSRVFNSRVFLDDIRNPPAVLVLKRISEFARRVGIDSPVEEKYCLNNWQLYLSGVYSRVLSQNLFVKTLFIYLLVLFIRFIFWAIKTLKK